MPPGTAAELARHARLANDLDAALSAAIRAGDEAAAVGGPDEAAQHYQQALELLADPARRERYAGDVSKLAVAAAAAVTNSGQPQRAAKLLGEQLAQLPDDAPAYARSRLLSARADALFVTEPDEDPLTVSQQAVDLLPDDMGGLRARVLAVHARILSGYGRYDEAQAVGLDALAVAERLDLHELVSDIVTTLSGLKKAGPNGLVGPRDLVRRQLVVHLRAGGTEVDVLEEIRDRPADVHAHRVRRDPGGLDRVADLCEVVPRLRRLDPGLLEGRDVVPDRRFVGALEHHAVLRALDSARIGDVLAEGVHDLLPKIVDRLDRVLPREVGHQAGLPERGDCRRVATLDRCREQRREVVAARRVPDAHVRIGLLEAVDHGLERLLLLAGPDRHHRDGAGDVLAPCCVSSSVVVAAAACGCEGQRYGEHRKS